MGLTVFFRFDCRFLPRTDYEMAKSRRDRRLRIHVAVE